MSQLEKVGTVATSVYTSNGYTCVRYHQTEVVKFNHDEIILNTNGWYTATTKTRMNQTSNQYNLGFQVYQKDYEWYVDYNGVILDFEDGLTLKRGA